MEPSALASSAYSTLWECLAGAPTGNRSHCHREAAYPPHAYPQPAASRLPSSRRPWVPTESVSDGVRPLDLPTVGTAAASNPWAPAQTQDWNQTKTHLDLEASQLRTIVEVLTSRQPGDIPHFAALALQLESEELQRATAHPPHQPPQTLQEPHCTSDLTQRLLLELHTQQARRCLGPAATQAQLQPETQQQLFPHLQQLFPHLQQLLQQGHTAEPGDHLLPTQPCSAGKEAGLTRAALLESLKIEPEIGASNPMWRNPELSLLSGGKAEALPQHMNRPNCYSGFQLKRGRHKGVRQRRW